MTAYPRVQIYHIRLAYRAPIHSCSWLVSNIRVLCQLHYLFRSPRPGGDGRVVILKLNSERRHVMPRTRSGGDPPLNRCTMEGGKQKLIAQQRVGFVEDCDLSGQVIDSIEGWLVGATGLEPVTPAV